jgi:hypothetical protein
MMGAATAGPQANTFIGTGPVLRAGPGIDAPCALSTIAAEEIAA